MYWLITFEQNNQLRTVLHNGSLFSWVDNDYPSTSITLLHELTQLEHDSLLQTGKF